MKKLSLKELKVNSFVTALENSRTQTVKGGDINSFLTIGTKCKTHAGKCKESLSEACPQYPTWI